MSDPAAYAAFAERLTATGIISDPWIYGEPRFRREPVVISRRDAARMQRAAEDVAMVYNELCLVVGDAPALLDDFFCLTPWQKAMWLASQPLWHGVARADVFVTDEGLAFAELNCDTPTGEAEAVVLGRLGLEDHPDAADPNAPFERAFRDVVRAVGGAELEENPVVGLIYPTEIPEDLPLVRLYKAWLERAGKRVLLGSPYNLGVDERGLTLFDEPVALALRHYKTDWWGERQSAWKDEDVPDKKPLDQPLESVLAACMEGKVSVLNPFGAVVPQNKRAMALMWEQIHRFTPQSQDIIRRFIPVTRRLEAVHAEQLVAQRSDWVLKSDYGAEGDEVVIGRAVTDDEWAKSISLAREGRWIVQRYFEAKVEPDGSTVNHGVFVLGGQAAGLYARIQRGATDERALSAPMLVRG